MIAPGMHVQIRDAEWRVRRVDMSSDGGNVLTCEGLSELGQGREALFLDRVEKVEVPAPESTALVDDTSSNFEAALHDVEMRERALVHVAMPRAVRVASITWTGGPIRLLGVAG